MDPSLTPLGRHLKHNPSGEERQSEIGSAMQHSLGQIYFSTPKADYCLLSTVYPVLSIVKRHPPSGDVFLLSTKKKSPLWGDVFFSRQ